MEKSKRYDTSHLIEDQSETGSRGMVLRNKPGITSRHAMDRFEKTEQIWTMDKLTDIFDADHRFTASNIRKIHGTRPDRIFYDIPKGHNTIANSRLIETPCLFFNVP